MLHSLKPLLLAFAASTCFPASALAEAEPAQETLKQQQVYEKIVDQRLQESIQWMADHPPVFKGPGMNLNRAFINLASGKVTEPEPINEALGAYYVDFLKDRKANPDKPRLLGPRPLGAVFHLYLKPRYHSLLTPDSIKAIENMCWRMVYRHSSILAEHEWPANSPTKSPWVMVGSENHDAVQKSGILLSLQVLMKAGAPYGPDAKLHDGHTVAEHYREWLKWFPDFYRERIREGLICEMAHPTTYGATTIRCVYEIEDLTDDAAVKRAARNFLDVYWATVACEFEPRTGIRGGLTMTRCNKGNSAQGTNYWARSLLSAYGWTDVHTDPTGSFHMVGMHFVGGYRPPEILKAIARDPDRAPYLGVSRRFGRREAHWDRGFIQVLFDDGDARNSYLRRDIWYTKDYTMSALSLDPARSFIGLVNQGRVMGVSFSHDIDDRLVVEAGTTPVDFGKTNSKGVLGALGPDCLIAARDPNAEGDSATNTRIFVSAGALWDNRAEDDGWFFTRAGDGYAALRIAGDKGHTLTPSPRDNGFYLDFNDIWAPVVIQTAQAGKHKSFEAFKEAVKAKPFAYTEGKLTYTSLSGETYEFWSNSQKLPAINGEPIDLNPPFTYDYPYLKMKRGSDTVTISHPGHPDLVVTLDPPAASGTDR